MNFMKNLVLLTIILLNSITLKVNAQAPKEYNLQSPLEIPIILSGTFGELRSNHFHSGIDIKTQGRIGAKVKAITGGYISRISISPWGYGKAIYVAHPNGLTSVYAHLNKFSPEIQKYVKNKQYSKQNYAINVFPKTNELKVGKGEPIAFSGNSGSSGGPHLHFEIRNSNTQKPINPFRFGYKVKDTRPPSINRVFLYNIDADCSNNSNPTKLSLKYSKETRTYYYNGKSIPEGMIGVGINSYDKLNNANNLNGVYAIEMKLNDESIYSYKMDTLDFSRQRQINSFIDYKYFVEHKSRIQKLFIEPGNKLNLYGNIINNGFISVKRGESYNIKIKVKDYEGNISKVELNIVGTNNVATHNITNNLIFKHSKTSTLENKHMKISIPKGALYKDAEFIHNFNSNTNVHKIGSYTTPLLKNATISIKIPEELKKYNKKIVLTRKTSGKSFNYTSSSKKGDWLVTKTRNFGNYKASVDTIKPTISPINISKNKQMGKERYITMKIRDDFSGINKYNAYIDGEWILMEYDAKRAKLKFDFSDIELKNKKHKFTLKIEDAVGNTSEYSTVFYR